MKGKERRRTRFHHDALDTLSLSLPTRIACWFDSVPYLTTVTDVVISSVELFAVALYFKAMDSIDCSVVDHSIFFDSVPLDSFYITANAVLALFFAAHFFLLVYTAASRRAVLLSSQAVVSLLTIAPMALSFFMIKTSLKTKVDYGDSVEIRQTIWSPSFLRVWWAHRHASNFISRRASIDPAIREMLTLATFVSSLIVTGMALLQFFDSLQATCPRRLEETFYFLMVTITTIGFGDSVPRTTIGRVVTSLVIFVAMFFLPTILGKFQELSAYLASQNSYDKAYPHVVILGEFSFVDLQVIAREFFSQRRKINVVLVTLEPLEEPTMKWLNQPELRDRVTVCVSDVLKKGQVLRYHTRTAEAVFLLSPRQAVAQRGDYDTMLKSVTVYRHEPDVPQLLLLKRGMHLASMRRTADVIFERERLKFHLMGIALRLPLFIPFMLNLIKSSESATRNMDEDFDEADMISIPGNCKDRSANQVTEGSDDVADGGPGRHRNPPKRQLLRHTWWQLYRRGASCNISVVPLPPTLNARLFASIALIIFVRLGVTVIGVIRKLPAVVGSVPVDDDVRLAPMKLKLGHSDQLIIIAPLWMDISTFVEQFEATAQGQRRSAPLSTVFAGAGPAGARGLVDGGHDELSVTDATRSQYLNSTSRLFSELKCGKRTKHSAYPFRDHIVLIDLAANDGSAALNSEEKIEGAQFQALDLLRLLRNVTQRSDVEDIPVVLLSPFSLSQEFAEVWPLSCRPVYHMKGFGGDHSNLRAAAIDAARAVVIFSTLEGKRDDAKIAIVVHMVHELLASKGREKVVPVLFELEDVSLAHVIHPTVCPEAQEEFLTESRSNYSWAPSYFCGRAISSTMIDTILFQCLFNNALPRILNCLMATTSDNGAIVFERRNPSASQSCHGASSSSAARGKLFEDDIVYSVAVTEFLPPLYKSSVEHLTYSDLFKLAILDGCVPLGLQRTVDSDERGQHLIGYRCFVTNPPRDVPLKESDEVYVVFNYAEMSRKRHHHRKKQ